MDAAGRPVAEHAVQFTRLFTLGGNPAEQISSTRMTDAEGGFWFTGLRPSDYEIKVLVADEVIARAAVTLAAGAMQVRGVTVVQPATPAVWDGTVLSSFEALQPVLPVGQEVKVRDEAGRATQGRVVAITPDELVISRRRFFRRSEERVFAEDIITKIDIVDSEIDKALIVGGVTLGVFSGAILAAGDDDAAMGWGILGMIVIPAAFGIAGTIDELTTEPFYERRSQTPRVTVSPLLGRGQRGVVAHVRF